MVDELTNGNLKKMLGMSVSVISTEHFMSAGLSSPWSVAKFAISDEDKSQVWHYFWEASQASAIFSVITAYMLKSWYPIASSALTLGYYHKLYKDALSRTPVENPTPVLDTNTPVLGLNLLPPTLDENGDYQPLSIDELERVERFDPDVSNYSYIKWDK